MTRLGILKKTSALSALRQINQADPDWAVYSELWQSECFEGDVVYDESGVLATILILGLTKTGWGNLRALESDTTSIGLITKYRWKVYGWLFSIVAVVIGGWLLWYYQHG